MTQNKPQTPPVQPPGRPIDTGSLHIEGFVKIFDPKTKETFVEKRA